MRKEAGQEGRAHIWGVQECPGVPACKRRQTARVPDWPRTWHEAEITLNFLSSCLYLLGAGITGVCHYTGFMDTGDQK